MVGQTVRDLARRLGACRVLGNRMVLLPEDVSKIMEATRCQSNSINAARSGTIAGQLPVGDYAGSCKTEIKDIAARQVAEIEVRQWKCHHDGPQAVLTFAQAALMYRAAGKPTRFLARIEDYWRDTLVKEISQGAIRKMALDLYPDANNGNSEQAGDCAVSGHYQSCRRLRTLPPYQGQRFKTEKKVKEPFTLEWVQTFRQYASPQLGALALFMFVTGARVSEALRVQWDDLDFKARTVVIRKTKISEGRIAHLPVPLITALANIPKVQGRPVFLYRSRNNCYRVWDTAVKRAGLKRLTFHSGSAWLRHNGSALRNRPQDRRLARRLEIHSPLHGDLCPRH